MASKDRNVNMLLHHIIYSEFVYVAVDTFHKVKGILCLCFKGDNVYICWNLTVKRVFANVVQCCHAIPQMNGNKLAVFLPHWIQDQMGIV